MTGPPVLWHFPISLRRAFLAKNIMDDGRGGMELVVSEEIDHVVEIAGTSPLGESAHFLGEDLLVAIASRHNPALGRVRVRVRDGAIDGG